MYGILALATAAALVSGFWWRGKNQVPDPALPDEGQPSPEVANTYPEVAHLIESLPGLVILLDRQGRVGFSSHSAELLRLTQRGTLAFPEVAALARSAMDTGEVVVQELSLRRPPLRKGLIDLRVRAVPMHDGGAILLMDDLTEEHRVAAVRRDFIANVSHELKTPVGAILLLAEALTAASDEPATVAHFAARLHAEAGRLSNLINDVIDLSRVQGEEPLANAHLVAADDLVVAAVEQVRGAAEAKGIDIVVAGSPGTQVQGMTDLLVIAIRNLLSNAVAYSPANTRVAIAVRRRDAGVEIAVKDQGIGIADTDQNRIFERFYRTDSARSRGTGGTGLGLSIVRNICRNHGGDVSVWSVINEGSTFTIQLPLHQSAADQPLADSPAERSAL